MILKHAIECAVNAFLNNPELERNQVLFRYKTMSPAAINRLEHWFKKFLSYAYRVKTPIQTDAPRPFPPGLARVARRYGQFNDQQLSDAYFLLTKLIKYVFRYTQSVRDNNLITAENVDRAAVSSFSTVLVPIIHRVMAVRALPERSPRRSASKKSKRTHRNATCSREFTIASQVPQ
jgi:hypothetical protein